MSEFVNLLSRVLTTSQTSPKRKEKMKGGEVIKRKETFRDNNFDGSDIASTFLLVKKGFQLRGNYWNKS